ncbi:GOLPH3/VPS74 family protein [Nonomuraea cavernae]|uniref:GOLPH3/VPS74 family protein n=1 Tax=Nonomuraea cavernae TaxID=2045107 RepID=UPI0033E0A178
MRKFRMDVGLALFALAGVVGGLAWVSEALLNSLMLWAVAAFLVWKGIIAFLGRIEPSQTPAPSPLTPADSAGPQKAPDVLSSPSALGDRALDTPPPPARTDHPDELLATGEVVKDFKLFMRRVIAVLLLFLLVPLTLISFIGGVVLLSEGTVLGAGAAFLLAGGLGWCCWGRPLRKLWGGDGDEESQVTEDHTRAGAESGSDYESGGTASGSAVPVSAPVRLSLPEEILLLSYRYGVAYDDERSAIACAGAELGELALRRRVQVTARKFRLFGVQVYVWSGAIRVLDPAPTGLAWADELMAELERLGNSRRRLMPFATARTSSESRLVSLDKWLRLRGDKALLLHREALTERRVLFHSPGFRPRQEERHYPDPSVRNELISRLRAVGDGGVPLDEHMLLLLNLVAEAGLNEELGLTSSTSQRFDRAHGNGAAGALPEEMRETSAMLAVSISRRSRGDGGGSDGDGGDGGE